MDVLDSVGETLIASLKRRFANVIDLEAPYFDPKYILATIVDSQTAFTVSLDDAKLLAIVKSAVCFSL